MSTGPVTSSVVSPDGLNIAVGTARGTVGVLDISSHAYHTLLRAHTAEVVGMAMRPNPADAPTRAAGAIAVGSETVGGAILDLDAGAGAGAGADTAGYRAAASGVAAGAGARDGDGEGGQTRFVPEVATVSTDRTVRVWSLETFDPLYEFEAPGENKKVEACFVYAAAC